MKTKLLGFIFMLNVLTCFAQGTNNYKLHAYQGYVNDFEGILTSSQISELHAIITKQEQETTNEIAIVTITSYKPYETLSDYSLALSNFWGIGKPDKTMVLQLFWANKCDKYELRLGMV